MSNLTITVDDDLLARARRLAHERGTSVQSLLRDYLRQLVGARSPAAIAEDLLDLMDRHGGRSSGRRFRRDEAYDGRV